MSRTGIHKTTHLHRMAFIGETIYQNPMDRNIESLEVKIQKGCRIAGAVLKAADDPEEQDYLNRIITPALLGSAWQEAFLDDLNSGPNDLMYRVVHLPRLDTAGSEDLATITWRTGVDHVTATAVDRPVVYTKVKIDGKPFHIPRFRRSYPSLTTGSLWLGAVPTARDIETTGLNNKEVIQGRVRESGYRMTETAIALARKIGSLPTISQLNDPYSPLTVELMRSGPSHLREKYVESIETATA